MHHLHRVCLSFCTHCHLTTCTTCSSSCTHCHYIYLRPSWREHVVGYSVGLPREHHLQRRCVALRHVRVTLLFSGTLLVRRRWRVVTCVKFHVCLPPFSFLRPALIYLCTSAPASSDGDAGGDTGPTAEVYDPASASVRVNYTDQWIGAFLSMCAFCLLIEMRLLILRSCSGKATGSPLPSIWCSLL